ncbi:hypothetical protein SH501x_000929 [Pirellulaceae bacterium SH501]
MRKNLAEWKRLLPFITVGNVPPVEYAVVNGKFDAHVHASCAV